MEEAAQLCSAKVRRTDTPTAGGGSGASVSAAAVSSGGGGGAAASAAEETSTSSGSGPGRVCPLDMLFSVQQCLKHHVNTLSRTSAADLVRHCTQPCVAHAVHSMSGITSSLCCGTHGHYPCCSACPAGVNTKHWYSLFTLLYLLLLVTSKLVQQLSGIFTLL